MEVLNEYELCFEELVLSRRAWIKNTILRICGNPRHIRGIRNDLAYKPKLASNR